MPGLPPQQPACRKNHLRAAAATAETDRGNRRLPTRAGRGHTINSASAVTTAMGIEKPDSHGTAMPATWKKVKDRGRSLTAINRKLRVNHVTFQEKISRLDRRGGHDRRSRQQGVCRNHTPFRRAIRIRWRCFTTPPCASAAAGVKGPATRSTTCRRRTYPLPI